MKRFTEYLNEDFDPAIHNADGNISINDPTVIDGINANLEAATSCSFRTPYNALEEVRKVLAYYKIFLPKGVFLDQNHGNDVFEISQFGEKMGMNNQGEVVAADDSPLFTYFEWSLNEKGMYEVFAAVVSQEELDEILADYDAEVADDETELQEQHSMAKVSKMLYKVVNKTKSQKQSDDVDAYIEHEKQGKTFTQTNEEMMPDLKKKMGAKKVTLPNMMRKEETVNEIADTPRGKEAVRQAVHRADATVVDAAINPPRSKKGKREAKNAMKTIDRGIAVHKKQGNVLDPYLKRAYGLKKEETINEVSKKRLASYIKQAADDKATAGIDYEKTKKSRHPVKKEVAADNLKRYQKRTKGISMAANKLAKEEVEQIDELHGKGSLEKIRDYHKNKQAEYSARTRGLEDTTLDRYKKMKSTVVVTHSSGKKEVIPGHGEAEFTAVQRNKDTMKAKRDLEGMKVKRATGLIKKRKSMKEEVEQIDEVSKKTLASYIKKASHDVATKSAATGRYADRANKARDKMKKGDYSEWQQGKKDDEFADKMFKKSWNRRKGIAKAADKLATEETDKPPFDMPTEKPSTPYKNKAAKVKQLARAAMKKAKTEKK